MNQLNHHPTAVCIASWLTQCVCKWSRIHKIITTKKYKNQFSFFLLPILNCFYISISVRNKSRVVEGHLVVVDIEAECKHLFIITSNSKTPNLLEQWNFYKEITWHRNCSIFFNPPCIQAHRIPNRWFQKLHSTTCNECIVSLHKKLLNDDRT